MTVLSTYIADGALILYFMCGSTIRSSSALIATTANLHLYACPAAQQVSGVVCAKSVSKTHDDDDDLAQLIHIVPFAFSHEMCSAVVVQLGFGPIIMNSSSSTYDKCNQISDVMQVRVLVNGL